MPWCAKFSKTNIEVGEFPGFKPSLANAKIYIYFFRFLINWSSSSSKQQTKAGATSKKHEQMKGRAPKFFSTSPTHAHLEKLPTCSSHSAQFENCWVCSLSVSLKNTAPNFPSFLTSTVTTAPESISEKKGSVSRNRAYRGPAISDFPTCRQISDLWHQESWGMLVVQ